MLRGYMEAHGCPSEPLRDWQPSIYFEGRDFGTKPYANSDPNRMVATWTDGYDFGRSSGYYHIRVSFIFVQNIRKTFFSQTESWDPIGFEIDDNVAPNRIPTVNHLANELAHRKPSLKYRMDWS